MGFEYIVIHDVVSKYSILNQEAARLAIGSGVDEHLRTRVALEEQVAGGQLLPDVEKKRPRVGAGEAMTVSDSQTVNLSDGDIDKAIEIAHDGRSAPLDRDIAKQQSVSTNARTRDVLKNRVGENPISVGASIAHFEECATLWDNVPKRATMNIERSIQ
ncbi:MAG: hypothetical protein AAFR96_08300 [Planctomycetota bacterium]